MPAKIYADSLQKAGKHVVKDSWWEDHGVEIEYVRFNGKHGTPSFGDYWTEGSNISVDTKRSVDELSGNIRADHDRFKRECQRAESDGYRLVILVENEDGFKEPSDVSMWVNGVCRRCKLCDPMVEKSCAVHDRKPIQGPTLVKAMDTMSRRYGVEFAFCAPEDAARIVCERLGVKWEE